MKGNILWDFLNNSSLCSKVMSNKNNIRYIFFNQIYIAMN